MRRNRHARSRALRRLQDRWSGAIRNGRSASPRWSCVSCSRDTAGPSAYPSKVAELTRPAKGLMRERDFLRSEAGIGCESEQKLLVRKHILEHRRVERRIFRRIPQIMRAKSGEAQESVEAVGVGREKDQRRGGQRFTEVGADRLPRF